MSRVFFECWPWWYWLSEFCHRPYHPCWSQYCVNNFVVGWLSSLVELFPFAGPTDRLPMISFATFLTWCTVAWTCVPQVLFSAVVAEFFSFFPVNGICFNTPVLLVAFATSCLRFHVFTCRHLAPCSLIAATRVNDLSWHVREFWTSGFLDPQMSWSKTLSLTLVLWQNWHFAATVGFFDLEIKSSTGLPCSCHILCNVYSVNLMTCPRSSGGMQKMLLLP